LRSSFTSWRAISTSEWRPVVAHFHGLSTDQVLAVAKEFKPESHWRL
jgi:hypothetical protein